MHNRLITTVLITFATLTAAANAQPFIEFEIDATKEDNQGNVTILNARMVFDAGAGEIATNTFALIDSEISVHQRPYAQFAGSIEPDPNHRSYTFDDLEQTTASVSTNLYSFNLVDNDDPFSLFVGIVGPMPSIQPPLTTLPDDPADYMINPAAGISGVDIDMQIDGQTTELDEFGNMGAVINRSAAIHYTVRIVDDPRIEECAADLNNDGRLDFFDVSMFLQLYQAGCP